MKNIIIIIALLLPLSCLAQGPGTGGTSGTGTSGSSTGISGTSGTSGTGTISTTFCSTHYTYDLAGNRIERHDTCVCTDCVVVICCATGRGADSTGASDSVTTNVNPIDGSSEITASLYPNPTHGIVEITTSQPVTNATVSLLDINGALIQQRNMTGTTISLDLESYASGTYMITVHNTVVNFVFKVHRL